MRTLIAFHLLLAGFALPLTAATNDPPIRGDGLCRFILHDYELSAASEASVNRVVADLLKKLQGTFDFPPRTNFHIRIRVFGRAEDFCAYGTNHGWLADGEYAGLAISNIAGYYSVRGHEVVSQAQKDPSYLANNLLHECTHAILHRQLRVIPLWLNEGCAVYYQYPRYMRDRSDVMRVITHRLLLKKFRDERSLPDLRAFLNLDDREFRKIKPERSYTISWSLFEFLTGSEKRRQIMNQVLAGLQKQPAARRDCAGLFEAAYPGGLAQMEKDWHAWIALSDGTVRGWTLPASKAKE